MWRLSEPALRVGRCAWPVLYSGTSQWPRTIQDPSALCGRSWFSDKSHCILPEAFPNRLHGLIQFRVCYFDDISGIYNPTWLQLLLLQLLRFGSIKMVGSQSYLTVAPSFRPRRQIQSVVFVFVVLSILWTTGFRRHQSRVLF